MAEKKKYNSILVSGRKDETLTYSKYVKDEESRESVKESLDKKVNITDELTTQQIKDGAITNEKMAAGSVGNTNLQDGSVSNEKLEDGSITNEKLAENSITKDKLKDNTIGVEKLDPELRQTINAATGLPENLVETIQNVDDTLKDHQSQLNDKQSQIDDKQQQITANDEDISLLQTRSTQMEETIKGIAATGGASVASAVTYDNTTSQLISVNIQGAIDELQAAKVDKTSILQEFGGAEDKVMSQKAVSDKLSDLSKHAVFILSYSSKITISINSEENKIIVVLPEDLTIIGSNSIRYYINESVEIQRDKEDGNLFFVIFNTETKAFKIIRYYEGLEINDVFMFGMNINIKQVTCNPNLVTFDTMPATKASDVYYDNQYIEGKTLNEAIDDLYKKKVDVSSIVQELGKAEDKVMSQKAVSDKLSYLNLYKYGETLELEKLIENHYVDYSGNIIQYNSYDVYKPVKLLKGQAINVECIANGVTVISLSETENITEESVLTVVKTTGNINPLQSFTYIATSDCFVVVSCKNTVAVRAQLIDAPNMICMPQWAVYDELNSKITEANNKITEARNIISNVGGAMYLGDSLPYIQVGKLHLGSTFCLCGVYFEGTEIIVPLKSHFGQYASKWRKMIFNPTTKVFDDLDYDRPIPSGYVTLGNYVTNAYGSNEFIDPLTNFDFNFIVKSLDANGNVINPTNAELKEMIDKGNDTNSIFYWNKPEVYDNIMLQSTRPLLNDSLGHDFKPLVLCHFSDIHGDSINLKRILEFYNNYKEYFTDIIHTGDIVNDKFDDDFEFWKNIEGSNIILNCIGNHDSSRKEGDHYINDITSKQCFDKFFKEQIENWNCVQPESAADLGLCYYYKDYSDSKIRLVVLDCMHYTDNQNSWFLQVLTEAKNKNYAVLVANHYQGGTMKCDEYCTFQSPLWKHADATINEKASATVDSFMNAGGDFIAWICGHTHRDLFGVLENYPNQTCIAVDCGLCGDYWNDSFRRRGTKSQDCFNIMSINRSLNTFSIYRVGNNIDLQLRSKKCLVYNYATHKLISNY